MSIQFTRYTRYTQLTLLTLTALTALALHTPAAADDTTGVNPLRISGFGTLGGTHVRGDGAYFVRDITQPKGAGNRGITFETDSRLGLQANYRISDEFEAVAQIASRYRHENDYTPELTWGFIKYSPHEAVDLRLGRVGFDSFIGADTRDIGYSYLWVRPPIEYFGTLLFPFVDGGDIVVRAPLARGIVRAKFFTGMTRQKVDSLLQQRNWAGNIQTPPLGTTQDLNKSRDSGGFIEYQDSHWTARLVANKLLLAKDFPPGSFNLGAIFGPAADQAFAQGNPALGQAMHGLLDDMRLAGKKTRFKSVHLVYDDGPLHLQGALSHFSSNSPILPTSRSAFAAAGYRMNRLTPYVMVASLRSPEASHPGQLARLGAAPYLVDVARFAMDNTPSSQTTWSLGARYDLTDRIALKFQADFVHNKDCSPVALPMSGPHPPCSLPLLWPNVPINWDGRAKIYTATLDFIF